MALIADLAILNSALRLQPPSSSQTSRPSAKISSSSYQRTYFMPIRPSQLHKNNENHRTKAHISARTNQHGIARDILPDTSARESNLFTIPTESLTHITSYLPPPTLLALGRTSKQLHEHVNDDNTWRRAYLCQFLGISPEDDVRTSDKAASSSGMLMIRRMEPTWKREFVTRWNLRRRYERSRTAPVTHIPIHSAAVDIHLMPFNAATPIAAPGLLAASLQYGVVSRSYPLTGKILRGYFDAAGTLNGLGLGNPNAEFSPDVSKCAMSADGGTAKILWGLRNGMVAVTVAARALDSGRVSGGRWFKCRVSDQHVGSVEDALWAAGPSYYCVTGGADGRVKLWDGRQMTCLWTSDRPKVHDPCLKVAIDLAHGVVASVMHSGQILVWQGLGPLFGVEDLAVGHDLSVRKFGLEAPARAFASPEPQEDAPAREIHSFHLQCPSDDIVSVISVYRNDTHFYRATIDLRTGDAARMAYGQGNTGAICAIEPVFGPADTSFVVVGDQLGCVAVYPWTDTCPTAPVAPFRKFEAFKNGSISALKWTPVVLVTGSSLGSAEVWDSLDFTHLRSFSSVGLRPTERVFDPASRVWDPVSRVVVEKDLLIMSVGVKVMAWLGGPVASSERKGKHLKLSTRSNNSVAKWQRQVELHKDIADSRRELEDEQTYTRQAYGREREQLTHLDSLGLSEVEAVEYVLMLSRDEEERRRRSNSLRQDEGVFIGDFDDLQTLIPNEKPFFMTGTSTSTNSSPKSNGTPRSYPRVAPSTSNAKVQVSPRFQPEPMEAGMSISPISGENSLPSSLLSSARSKAPVVGDVSHFPSMSSTPTNNSPGTPIRRSMSGSPDSPRSVWSTPLRFSKSEGPSPPSASNAPFGYRRPMVSGPSSPSRQRLAPGGLSISRLTAETKNTDGTSAMGPSTRESLTRAEMEKKEAEDLSYAIELSLAEARGRGENV